jgi:hypothetical protein
LGFEPGNKLIQFASLVAFLATQHGEGKLAKIFGPGAGGLASGPLQQGAGGEEFMKPLRSVAEEGGFLFEIDVDAAEKDGGAGALIHFIESEWKVERNHDDLMAHPTQNGDEGVIADAEAAIHRAGARRDLEDGHWENGGME